MGKKKEKKRKGRESNVEEEEKSPQSASPERTANSMLANMLPVI